ncbi:MAG: hypothetical protein QXU18_11920, partial [Thermoplasmatales archaeon]
ENSVILVYAPLSGYNFTQNSYQMKGNSYQGSHSSFSYSLGELTNYSLVNRDSSVQVISSISTSNGTILSLNTAGLSEPGNNGLFASDGIFPLIYLNGFGTTINVTLANGFHFSSSENGYSNGPGGNGDGIPGQDHSGSRSFLVPEEHVYKIMNGHKVLGYVDTYGKTILNNTTLEINSPLSFMLVRFLPSFQSSSSTNHGNDDLENATTEIYVDKEAYFVPFSPNITSQNLTFEQNILKFDFIQNGTQNFVIIIQGNFSVSSFSLLGPGQNGSHYTVKRTSNQTIISFSTNGSGQGSLSLAVAPILIQQNQIPLIELIVTVTTLIVVVMSLIIYSRKKWVSELEKE